MLSGLYLKLAGVAALLLVIFGCWMYVHHLKSEVADLITVNATLQANNHSLLVSINDQNTAITKLKMDSDAREQAGKAAIAVAQKAAQVHVMSAGKIYSAAPPASSATCAVREKATLDLINGAAK